MAFLDIEPGERLIQTFESFDIALLYLRVHSVHENQNFKFSTILCSYNTLKMLQNALWKYIKTAITVQPL